MGKVEFLAHVLDDRDDALVARIAIAAEKVYEFDLSKTNRRPNLIDSDRDQDFPLARVVRLVTNEPTFPAN